MASDEEDDLWLVEPVRLFTQTIKLGLDTSVDKLSKDRLNRPSTFCPAPYEDMRQTLVQWFPDAGLRRSSAIEDAEEQRRLADQEASISAKEEDAVPGQQDGTHPESQTTPRKRRRVKTETNPEAYTLDADLILLEDALSVEHLGSLPDSVYGIHPVNAFAVVVHAPRAAAHRLHGELKSRDVVSPNRHMSDSQAIHLDDDSDDSCLLIGHLIPSALKDPAAALRQLPLPAFRGDRPSFTFSKCQVTLRAPFLDADDVVGPSSHSPWGRAQRGPSGSPLSSYDPLTKHHFDQHLYNLPGTDREKSNWKRRGIRAGPSLASCSTSDVSQVVDPRSRATPKRLFGELRFDVVATNEAFEYGRKRDHDHYVLGAANWHRKAPAEEMKLFFGALLQHPSGNVELDDQEADVWSRGTSYYAPAPCQPLPLHSFAKPQRGESKKAKKKNLKALLECYAHRDRHSRPNQPGTGLLEDTACSEVEAIHAAKEEMQPARDMGQPHLPLNNSLESLLEACRPPTDSPELFPPSSLIVTPLKRYQARAVAWMASREEPEGVSHGLLYPEWIALRFKHLAEPFLSVEKTWEPVPAIRESRSQSPETRASSPLSPPPSPSDAGQRLLETTTGARSFYLDLLTGTVSLKAFRGDGGFQPGGGLMDGLGLGKSLEILSLIAARPRDLKAADTSRSALMVAQLPESQRPFISKATLIVAPAALISQWTMECEQHAPSLSIFRWDQATVDWSIKSTMDDIRAGARHWLDEFDPDIVLCSYELLRDELRRSKKKTYANSPHTPLLEIWWHRVCLDEAQLVANSSGAAAEGVACLWRTNGWVSYVYVLANSICCSRMCAHSFGQVVTSTPASSSITELAGIVSFLDHDPLANPTAFANLISNGFAAGDSEHIRRARGFFSQIFWRNTREHVADELELPSSSDVEMRRKRLHSLIVALRQLISHPQIATGLGYDAGNKRMSFKNLTMGLLSRLHKGITLKHMEVVKLVITIAAGHRFFEEEPEPQEWRGGVPVWADDVLTEALRRAIGLCELHLAANTADEGDEDIEEEDAASEAESELGDPSVRPERGTVADVKRRMRWNEAAYWCRVLLKEPTGGPPELYDAMRLENLFFEKRRVAKKSVDPNNPRYHDVVLDAGTQDMAERMDAHDASGSGRNEFENPTLKINRLRGNIKGTSKTKGANQRGATQVWYYSPRLKLERLMERFHAALSQLFEQEKELEFLRNRIVDEGQARREGSAGPSNARCCICLEDDKHRGLLPCLHGACMDCLSVLLNKGHQAADCPICRRKFRRTNITEILPEAPATGVTPQQLELGFGAKIDAVILDMRARKFADPQARFVVFSVWKRCLALISEACTTAGIMSLTFEGSEQEQASALSQFRIDKSIDVLCVPLSHTEGAAGLTLTMANVSYFMEPCLNASLEQQARGRINRIGQTRNTTNVTILMENTFEPKIADISRERLNAARGAHGHPSAAGRSEPIRDHPLGENNTFSNKEIARLFELDINALRAAEAERRSATQAQLNRERNAQMQTYLQN
ncbi:related to snf2 family helicase atpase [Ceraceosorus bombacis]|uniref:Related to snf2 family helicase atpase n=1 Tax=Ceraceosorus bombacis TaxID=401625 RepID=A0A0P1BA62_9BASI|nr:related to snf2 family helicase atpase [Ceraceosorus bombacis]